ncbi:MAG: DNA adenine methylase [Paludibacteraceae bacterium]|nr:DNA adenine methylase [Paludibacteraceae bacterium]
MVNNIVNIPQDTKTVDVLEIINTFQTTRYQGSKRKILPWLYDCTKDLNFETVLDAFGGSGMVSCLFKHMGKKVTYNDIFKFNKIIGESTIENNNVLLTEDDIKHILEPKNAKFSFISNTFKDIYYLNDENNWLDMAIYNIESLSDIYKGKELRFKKAIAYNALFQACMAKRPYNLFHRKNLNMRIRNVKRNFGNKSTWDKPFPVHFVNFVNEINKSIYDSGKKCRTICSDVFSIKQTNYDAVYLDPPYIKRKGERNETADYLGCYHFLEGIANYSSWPQIIESDSPNKRIQKSYAPNYFTGSDASELFERLIKKFRKSVIILSYKYGGDPTIDDLSKIILKYKTQLKVYDRHYKYALNKKNRDETINREYLIIGY